VSHFDISRNGTLVYLPGAPEDIFPKTLWVDRSGHVEPFGLSRDFRELRFSPEGRRIAFRESKGNADIWTYDVVRGTMTRVTSRWDNVYPVWMLDGNSILYFVLIPGPGLVRKAADGTGIEEVILEPDAMFLPGSVSPDGQNLSGWLEGDIWILPLTEELEPRVFIESPFAESQPRFSPDGQWLAYVSDESGRQEIYVQPFPGPGSRISISTRGGRNPVWRRDSKELFFLGDNELLSVAIETDPTFRAGTTSVVFERPNIIDYDVMPDGNRFLVIEANLDASPTEIHVVVNWFEELNRLVPTN
jgi:Tol biopolymer transport system component